MQKIGAASSGKRLGQNDNDEYFCHRCEALRGLTLTSLGKAATRTVVVLFEYVITEEWNVFCLENFSVNLSVAFHLMQSSLILSISLSTPRQSRSIYPKVRNIQFAACSNSLSTWNLGISHGTSLLPLFLTTNIQSPSLMHQNALPSSKLIKQRAPTTE